MARKTTENGSVTIDHPGNPEQLVKDIFARLRVSKSVILVAGEEDSGAIINAVIRHTFSKFPLHAEVECVIGELLTFRITASAPGTFIEVNYRYKNPGNISYLDHYFAEFHTPPFIGGSIKRQIINNIKEPKIALAHSLNHEADRIRVRDAITAEILGVSYSTRDKTTSTRIGCH